VCVASAPEEKMAEPAEQQNQPVPSAPAQPPPVDLHPRKRKMKQSKESQASAAATSASEPSDTTSSATEVHPHDQPITNCYQLFLNIRKQVCVTWSVFIFHGFCCVFCRMSIPQTSGLRLAGSSMNFPKTLFKYLPHKYIEY